MSAKLYKVEVSDLGDEEINKMAVAYEAIRRLPTEARGRCLRWLTSKLAADDRKAEETAARVRKLKRMSDRGDIPLKIKPVAPEA